MCCFAGHVSDVSGTNIFARVDGDREYLAYEMTFSSDDKTAMILWVPEILARQFRKFWPVDVMPQRRSGRRMSSSWWS